MSKNTDNWYVVDVEADGRCPGKGSMVCFAVMSVKDYKFYKGYTAPITGIYDPARLAISGYTREDHMGFRDHSDTIPDFISWLNITNKDRNRPIFVSDNPTFDFMWLEYYLALNNLANPFGWSGRRIGDLFCGLEKDLGYRWKKHRITKHTHNPVDDCKGNVEAIKYLISKF